MPKTVTTDFENVQARPAFPVERKLFYKRRYWDTGTSAYIWEGSWVEVDKSDVKTFSIINQKLDTVQLNQLLSSNVSPTLSNSHHVWEEGYNWSKFNADGVATDGYLPYLTKVQIRGGFRLDDGTTEVKNLFTGYAVKFLTQSRDDTVRLTAEGRERILKDANAENVNEGVIDDETPAGAIDSSNKVYTTANNGVGKITEVIVDGSEIEVGKDCSISDTNDPDLPATITCNVAPVTSITCDYFYWKQDELFEDLVVDLLQEAGLTAPDYTVDPVVFPNDVLNEWDQTDKTDWDAYASRSNTENTSTPGDVNLEKLLVLYDNFQDGTLNKWSVSGNMQVNTKYGSLRMTNRTLDWNLSANASAPQDEAYGTWEFNVVTRMNDTFEWFDVRFIVDGANYYSLKIRGLSINAVDLTKNGAVIASGSLVGGIGSVRTIKIERSVDGTFVIKENGVTKLTHTDNSFKTSTTFTVYAIGTNSGAEGSAWFDDVKFPDNKASGFLVTQVLDTGLGNPKSWNLLDYTVTTPTGTTISFETISSTTSGYPGDGHADWIAIAGNRQINSAVKRYLWARVNFTSDVYRAYTSILHDITVNYATTSSIIALANFTGQSVFDAISELAKMPDYEIGFDADEKFFFRRKTSSPTPDFTFNESDGLIEVISRYEDVSRIYNWIRVTYGAYTKDATPITEGDSQPHSFDKYGKRKLTISGGQIVISESADIATGIAQTFFERYKLPRIVMKIKVKYYPQINLSDVVQVKFDPKKELERIRWDDGVTPYDDGIHRWDGFRTQIIDYLTCKVTGISYNIDASQVTLDLEEIL